MTTDPRLPRADEAERYLVSCAIDWPMRAHEFLPLAKPSDFFHDFHRQLWQRLQTQLALYGEIDFVAAAKKIGAECVEHCLDLAGGAPTSAHAESRAEMVKLAARGRQLHEVLTKGADAILRGRPADAVLAQVQLALEPFEAEAIGA